MSFVFKVETNDREQILVRAIITGETGSGKSRAAMRIALGLSAGDTGKVAIISTEFGRGRLYPDLANFALIDYVQPADDPTPQHDFYSPKEFSRVLRMTENAGFEVIIIDGITPQWDAVKGMADANSLKGLAQWKEPKEQHNRFWDRLLRSPAHIIMTCQTKDKVLQEGTVITKLYNEPCQDSTKFSMVHFRIGMESESIGTIIKNSTGMFKDIEKVTDFVKLGEDMREWAGLGPKRPEPERATDNQRETLLRLSTHPEVPAAGQKQCAEAAENAILTAERADEIITKANKLIKSEPVNQPAE